MFLQLPQKQDLFLTIVRTWTQERYRDIRSALLRNGSGSGA